MHPDARTPGQPPRKTLFEDTIPVSIPLIRLDLPELRAMFSGLFDRAAHAVHMAGFDQDDTIVERWLRCRTTDGTELEVPTDFLADRDTLIAHALCHLVDRTEGVGPPSRAEDVHITALKVTAIHEAWP